MLIAIAGLCGSAPRVCAHNPAHHRLAIVVKEDASKLFGRLALQPLADQLYARLSSLDYLDLVERKKSRAGMDACLGSRPLDPDRPPRPDLQGCVVQICATTGAEKILALDVEKNRRVPGCALRVGLQSCSGTRQGSRMVAANACALSDLSLAVDEVGDCYMRSKWLSALDQQSCPGANRREVHVAQALYDRGRRVDALRLLKRLQAAAPGWFYPRLLRAAWNAEMGRKRKAGVLYRELMEAAADEPTFRDRMRRRALRLGGVRPLVSPSALRARRVVEQHFPVEAITRAAANEWRGLFPAMPAEAVQGDGGGWVLEHRERALVGGKQAAADAEDEQVGFGFWLLKKDAHGEVMFERAVLPAGFRLLQPNPAGELVTWPDGSGALRMKLARRDLKQRRGNRVDRILRFDAAGNIRWVESFYQDSLRLHGLAAGAAGRLWLSGTLNSRICSDLGGKRVCLVAEGREDAFLGLIDAQGKWIWMRRAGGAEDGHGGWVQAGPDGLAIWHVRGLQGASFGGWRTELVFPFQGGAAHAWSQLVFVNAAGRLVAGCRWRRTARVLLRHATWGKDGRFWWIASAEKRWRMRDLSPFTCPFKGELPDQGSSLGWEIAR